MLTGAQYMQLVETQQLVVVVMEDQFVMLKANLILVMLLHALEKI